MAVFYLFIKLHIHNFMTDKTTESIFIASLGTFDLSLPIIRAGSGSPRVLIINNMHGDELTGFYILEKFINELPDIIRGSITIVTTANPLGLIHRQRFVPLDEEDINRGYPPPPKARGIGAACKKILIDMGLKHDIIIDLHTFTRPCLSAGLLLQQNNQENSAMVKNMLSSINTDIILSMDIKGEEKRVENSYGIYMIGQGKVFVAIEYPPIRQVTDSQISRYADGLMRALSIAKILPGQIDSDIHAPPVFERQQIISCSTGLFAPAKNLGEEIKINDTMGDIINIKTLEKKQVLSPYNGKLTEIADRQLFRFGDKLATVGKVLNNAL